MTGSNNVIGYLKSQHKQIKGLFEEVVTSRGSDRAAAFQKLQQLMKAHEAAEEEVVHPAAETAIKEGPAEVAAREKEEGEARRSLAALASLDVSSGEFESKIRVLQAAVLAHAAKEEKEEFDKLEGKIDEATLKAMRTQAVAVEADVNGEPRAKSN